jgi:hypothetical protein
VGRRIIRSYRKIILEFTLLASEIIPVIKSFEDHNVDVTAVHNHWLCEDPTLYYMHGLNAITGW